jgi:hypothetical protein
MRQTVKLKLVRYSAHDIPISFSVPLLQTVSVAFLCYMLLMAEWNRKI